MPRVSSVASPLIPMALARETPVEALAAHYRAEKARGNEISEKLKATEAQLKNQTRETRVIKERLMAAEIREEKATGECDVLKAVVQAQKSEIAEAMEKVPAHLRGGSLLQGIERIVSEWNVLKSLSREVASAFGKLTAVPAVLNPLWAKIRQLGDLVGVKVPEHDKGVDFEDT